MKSKCPLFLMFLCFWKLSANGQNLPSLLSERNIYATFSITAYDEKEQEWGIAVATHNIYVGSSTIYIEPGIGAFSVIAETEPQYALNGFKHLKAGSKINEAIQQTKDKDEEAMYRQVAGIDAHGNAFAFTGEALKYWGGLANHIIGEHYIVMGNQLADSVLVRMAHTFEQTEGTLAQRLLEALLSGQEAGGQISGQQSAALVVKGTKKEWYNQINLRVDHSNKPFVELKRLLDFHYGRIKLNQAYYALRLGNRKLAKKRLTLATSMLNGWDGMYPKIAAIYAEMGEKDIAADYILKGISESEKWKIYLPAFYFMREHPKLKGVINPDSFTQKDWENAIQMLIKIGQNEEAITIGERLLTEELGKGSYFFYLLAKAYKNEGHKKIALQWLEKAIASDDTNIEALQMYEALRK